MTDTRPNTSPEALQGRLAAAEKVCEAAAVVLPINRART